jgi:hypothetical protein
MTELTTATTDCSTAHLSPPFAFEVQNTNLFRPDNSGGVRRTAYLCGRPHRLIATGYVEYMFEGQLQLFVYCKEIAEYDSAEKARNRFCEDYLVPFAEIRISVVT